MEEEGDRASDCSCPFVSLVETVTHSLDSSIARSLARLSPRPLAPSIQGGHATISIHVFSLASSAQLDSQEPTDEQLVVSPLTPPPAAATIVCSRTTAPAAAAAKPAVAVEWRPNQSPEQPTVVTTLMRSGRWMAMGMGARWSRRRSERASERRVSRAVSTWTKRRAPASKALLTRAPRTVGQAIGPSLLTIQSRDCVGCGDGNGHLLHRRNEKLKQGRRGVRRSPSQWFSRTVFEFLDILFDETVSVG